MKKSEEIAEVLRDEIIAGVHPPKCRLLEEELSERFAVSRTPIREALNHLSSAGLVTITPYKGAYVSDVNLEEIRDIYELRIVLEAFATELAARNITESTIEQLRTTVNEMETAIAEENRSKFAASDDCFHGLILSSCPNRVTAELITKLLERTASFRRLSWQTIRGMNGSLEGHKRILDAMNSGDPVLAGECAARHIRLYLKDNIYDTPKNSVD